MSEATVIDRDREHAHMLAQIERLVPDRDAGLRLFRNVRRIAARQWQRSPNWVLAMQIYATGSTYGYAICRHIGIDPEAKNAARTPGGDDA